MQLKSTNAVFLQTKREYFIVYLFRSFLERFCFPLFVQERGQPPGMGYSVQVFCMRNSFRKSEILPVD